MDDMMSAKTFQGHRWNSHCKLSPTAAAPSFLAQTLLTKLAVCSCVRVRVAALSSAKLTESPASFSRLMASNLAGLSGSAVIISVASVHTGTTQQHKGPVMN